MGRVLSAKVHASSHGRTTLKVLWEEGAIVAFEKIEIDEASSDGVAGKTKNNEIVLTVDGEPQRGVQQCEN
jgi:hypothetical protein